MPTKRYVAESIGYPVVVKLCSPDILHKSDVGGVVLNLSDADAVRAAFERVRRAAGTARFDGALVARMVRGWGEIMVGVRRDPVFGLVALAGIGGTAVEIFRQMSFGLAPVSRERARAMLTQSRAAALCAGHRASAARSRCGGRCHRERVACRGCHRRAAGHTGNQSVHRERGRAGCSRCGDYAALIDTDNHS
jgi:hypothetical protein